MVEQRNNLFFDLSHQIAGEIAACGWLKINWDGSLGWAGGHFITQKFSVMLYDVFSGPPNSPQRSFWSSNLALIACVVGVLVYALLTVSGLQSDRIPLERSYLLLALPCLVPAFWYLIGFLRHEGGDFGLILSSIGWFLAALTLFWKHLSTAAELARGARLDQVSESPATWVFALASVAAILAGAVQSGRYWVAKNQT